MFKKFTDHLRTERAFACVYQNDIQGLLKCIDQGFNINTRCPINLAAPNFEWRETVFAYALRRHQWDLMKEVLRHVQPKDKEEMVDFVRGDLLWTFILFSSSPDSTRLDEKIWTDIGHETFESSPMHFCLWQILKSDNNTVATHLETCLTKVSLEGKQNLQAFLRSCEALEQKKALGSQVGSVKEDKISCPHARKM